jgi:hypothetical protein
LRTLQLFQCTECLHRFTGEPGKNRTYPLKLILDAVSTFNLGHPITETRSILRRRYHREVPDRTVNSWLHAYKGVAAYWRLRAAGKKLFDPRSIIVSRFFEHRQVYRFQVHNAKLELSLRSPIHRHLSPLRGYLTAVQRDFPHHLFQNTAERSSTFPAKLQPAISRKENHATRTAALVLPTALNNKKRHETLQRFMRVGHGSLRCRYIRRIQLLSQPPTSGIWDSFRSWCVWTLMELCGLLPEKKPNARTDKELVLKALRA